MLNRLEKDRSLARFAGQFVPLKLVTDGNPQWNKWARQYPIDGQGIPRLYVIRADGKKLYGGVGSLPGSELPQMMLASLQQSGRSFSDAESMKLQTAVLACETALGNRNLLAAAVALSSVVNFGLLDESESYAQPASEAKKLYERLVTELDASVQAWQARLGKSEDSLDAIIAIFEAAAAYKLFPNLKSKAASITREINNNKELVQYAIQADALVKARSMRSSQNVRVSKRSAAAYAGLIRRFPGTRVDEIARKELAEIEPDASVLRNEEMLTAPTEVGFRQWNAQSGSFTVTAKYVQQKAGKVQLLKKSGETIVVDIVRLSDGDQAFLKEQ